MKKVKVCIILSTTLIIVSFALIFGISKPAAQELETVFAVNCGGRAYTSSDDIQFASDTGYTGGEAYSSGTRVSGTDDATLYSSERYGDCTYTAAVPNGNYMVTLYFAETYISSKGSRSFDVIIEDNEEISNLDIYAEVESNTAYTAEIPVKVDDGKINIEFSSNIENAKINAIKVTALSYSGEPTAKISIDPAYPKPEDEVTVDASESTDRDGIIKSIEVDFGDGYIAKGDMTSHKYSEEGEYTITATITDNDDKIDIVTKKVKVSSNSSECTETRPSNPPRGSFKKVARSSWAKGGIPNYVNMYIHVPGAPSSKPAILVGCHSCGTSANGYYNAIRNIASAADKNGFILIVPEATGRNCWDAGSRASLTHDGGGDTQAIAQMIEYTIDTYKGDRERVYIMGGSSGAMMTQAMLAVYPDIFKAGSARAGVPAGCWGDGYSPGNQWSGNCAGGRTTKSAQQWGDQARAMYPGYDGPRPRVQLFHGMADTTINHNNMTEAIKLWTNIFDLKIKPDKEDSITTKYRYNRKFWKDDNDYVIFETWSSPGNGHSMSYEEDSILKFLGLDEFRCTDPQFGDN
jgi:poly(hydroxyalkanoate) depolymerase family esterase